MKYCGKCGHELNLNTGLCPNCDEINQTNLNKKRSKKKITIVSIISLVLLVAIIIGVLFSVNYNEMQDSDVVLSRKPESFTLQSNRDYILTGKKHRITFFIDDQKNSNADITLRCADKEIEKLYDDGESKHGDVKKGDGIFSAKLDFEESEEKNLKFTAVSDSKKSNTLTIPVYSDVPSEEYEKQDIADKELQKVVNDVGFKDFSISEQKKAVDSVFYQLIKDGYIKKDNVFYSKETLSYGFRYSNGDLGSLYLNDNTKKWEYSGNMVEQKNETTPLCFERKEPDIKRDALIVFDYCERGKENKDLSFDRWYGFFEEINDTWNRKGIKTKNIINPTVSEYKTMLKDVGIVYIAAHGGREKYGNYEKKRSVICLNEKVTWKKAIEYKFDISLNLISRNANSSTYELQPNFFIEYYGGNYLDNKIIMLGNCYAFGTPDDVDYELSNKFKECGAEAVVGSVNQSSVLFDDDTLQKGFTTRIIEETICTMGSKEGVESAFNNSLKKLGNNYEEFLIKYYKNFEPKGECVDWYPILNSDNKDVKLEELLIAVIDGDEQNNNSQIENKNNNDTKEEDYNSDKKEDATIQKDDNSQNNNDSKKNTSSESEKQFYNNIDNELSEYMFTDFYTFVNSFGDMEDVHSTLGVSYKNDYLIVSYGEVKDKIDFIEINNPCDYSLNGIKYGMTVHEAQMNMQVNDYELEESTDNYMRYKNDFQRVNIYSDDGKSVSCICLYIYNFCRGL